MSQSSRGKRGISLGPCPADEFSGRFDERKRLLKVLRRAIDQSQPIDHGQVVMVSGTRGSGKSSFLNWAEYEIQNEKNGFGCPAIKKEFPETTGMVFTTYRELLSNLKEHQKVGWFRKSLDDPNIKKSINAALDVLEKVSSLTGPYSMAINAGVAPARRFISEENFDDSKLLLSLIEIFRILSKELLKNNRFLAIILDDVHWLSGPDFQLIKDLIRSLPANIVLIIAFRLETDSEKKYIDLKNEIKRFGHEEIRLGGMIPEEIKEFATQRYNMSIDKHTANFLRLRIGDPICLVSCFNLLQELELEPNFKNFQDIYSRALDSANCIYTGLDSRWQNRVNSLCILHPPLYLSIISCMLSEVDLVRLKEELDQSLIFKKLETERYDFAHPSLREYLRKELPGTTRKDLNSRAAKCLEKLGEKGQIELSMAEHLFVAEEYEKALDINYRIGAELNDLRYYDSALPFMERAEICSRKTQNKENLAASLHQMGLILQSLNRIPEALDAYNHSLEVKKEIGDKTGEAQIFYQIGIICEEREHFEEALKNYNLSLEIRREIGDKTGEVQILRQIVMVYERTDRFQDAQTNYNQIFETNDPPTNRFEELTESFQSDPVGWLMEKIVAPEKKVAFFVGPGISVGSGLPNFFNFISNFIGSICPSSLKKSDVDEICRRLRPEVLLQIVQQVHKDRTLDFYCSLESNNPNANHFFLALALKAGHCVFTTNVDTLIEQACKKIGLPCNPIVHENQYEHFLKKQSKGDSRIDFTSQLFKLHGSIESDKVGAKKYESIRFVLDRVGLGLTENQDKIFSECLQDYDFIFLGYSGNDHFSVLPVLLTVDSDQKIYWFKFEPGQKELEFYQGIEYFRNRKRDLLDKVSEGTTSVVKWGEISILEVLSERENSILAIGDSSHIVKKSVELVLHIDYPKVQEKEFVEPAWVKSVTDFERHLLAAMLLIRMRDITSRTEDQLKDTENCAKNEKERAEVEKLRASTFSITRRLGNIKSSKEDLIRAINRFEVLGDFISAAEAYLELANLMRIDRSFESAKETLDKAERLLTENKSAFQEKNRSYDWPRLMAQLFHHRGLVYGLGQRGTMADKIKAINYCDEAQNFAKQAGDVSRMAAVLNARGLIIYQLAERSGSLLREAESSLENAFALYTRIGDPRTSFQPLRNLLLVQRLRALQSKLHTRNYWLDKAQRDCDRAGNYLNLMKIGGGEPSADTIEVQYRQAQVFGLKGDKEKARRLFQDVLAYWQGKNDLHQQARVWQDLFSLAEDWGEGQECICHLLSLIESLFQSEKECMRYKNDILRLENIRDMLIDAYLKAYEHHDLEYLDKIVALMEQGGKMAEKFEEKDLSQEFKIWSSGHRE